MERLQHTVSVVAADDAEAAWPSEHDLETAALVAQLERLEVALSTAGADDARDGSPAQGLSAWLEQRRNVVLERLAERGLDVPTRLDGASRATPRGGGEDASPEVLAALRRSSSESAAQVGQMERALVTRSLIGQALGILMERHQLTADQAFDALRHVSSTTNSKLHVVADRLVQTGALPAPDGSSGDRRPDVDDVPSARPAVGHP